MAEDLRPWNDDSGIVVTPYPTHFAPASESANLVTRVFHDIDSSVDMICTIVVTDADGREVRHFKERQTFAAGEPMQFAPTWNGRDDLGRYLPNGPYTVTATIDMRAAGGPTRLRRDDEETAGETRVHSIHQTFAGTVVLDSVRRGRPGEVKSQTPNEPGFPYNFYFGTLHNQTSYSDGGHPNDSNCVSSTTHAAGDLDPAQAYAYARNTGHLDFMGITDHNHQFNDACSGCTAAQIIARYHTGLTAAANATVDGTFVGIYGMEWGYIATQSFPNEGHVGLFEVPKLFGWEPSSTCTIGVDCYYEVYTNQSAASYAAMYTAAKNNPSAWGAFGQFMHPADGTKSAAGQGVDYNNIQYTVDGDDVIHTAAVISGPATDPSTAAVDTGALYAGEPVNGAQYAAYTSTDMYNRILGAGYHVAPAADPDVHCANYGTSTRDRVVILATTLTKASIMDAIHHRRVYATSNSNTQLVYTLTSGATKYYMGDGGIRATGPVPTSGPITVHVSVWDPDAGQTATSIKIKEPVPGTVTGADTVIATGTTSPFDYTFTPTAGNHTYYVYVTMSTGDRLWSAPVWINEGAAPDTTPPTTSITAPANNATVSGTVSVTASASDNVGVTKVEFYLDNALQSTATVSPYSWSWNTTTALNGAHALSSKAYDAAGNVGTSAAVNVTVSNAPPDTTPPTTAITAPVAGATVTGTTAVSATASDNVAVTKVEFYLDNVLQSTDTTAPYDWSWNTTTSANGAHSLTSKAYDAANNVGTSAAVNVTVSNVADYSLSVTPASVTVTAGSAASYTVNIARSGGFTGGVTFSISGLPAGAGATFTPNSATAGSSALSITTTTATAAGSYLFTVTGTSGALSHTATGTLVVNAAPAGNFTLAVTPASVTVQSNGGTATYTVNITRTSFTSSISFSVSGLPAGVTASFSPNPTTGNSTTLTLTVPASTAAGTYTFTVTGTGGGLTRTATSKLVKSTTCDGNC
jgi:hypothetical protein